MKVLEPFEAKLNETLQHVVGHAAADLSRSTAQESHIGNLSQCSTGETDSNRYRFGQSADPQSGIPSCPITSRMLFNVLPSDTLVTMRLSGAQIKHILGRDVMSLSGLRVKLDASKPEGKRLISVWFEDGLRLRTEFYTVTTNDFLFMGGDGYKDFAEGIDVEDTGILVRDALAEHIAHLGTVSPYLDGRIQVSR